MKAGDPIEASDTPLNRNLGIRGATGWVCYVTPNRVSFFLNHGGYGLEAGAPPDVFGMHFEPRRANLPSAPAYIRTSHFSADFPGCVRR